MNVGRRKRAKIKGSITVFPAHAGVILEDDAAKAEDGRLSRTCGGDPDVENCGDDEKESFPHMRG